MQIDTLSPDIVARPQETPAGQDAVARQLNERFADASPQEILEAAIHELFPGHIALVSSFGAESALLLHFLAEVDRSVPILFLDTGKHFDETLMYRDILAGRFNFQDMRAIEPDLAAIAQHDPHGKLWETNPDLCCQLRKVDPLQRALGPFDAWITGRKRYQSRARAALPTFEYLDGRIKVNPLARFTAADIEAAFKQFKLPQHPLYYDGFKSIGCKPCTLRVADGDDARAGRWAGTDKTECGIHR
ncbi:phosphoadenylyl-sulfate reductase [Dongia rigui]|uniref:Adenosine 5'-phosphosulfate reductase n=1 Tax=Dongia rigui TaxID=940149 RepID=A0ABU5E3H2_9PROT|nr:phosphoadenylyl-sulfate reductase [Dongia rigui]MDY0874148.1 phosphoadenylyl-sulfate reductase [Dongia rigui]